MSRTYTNVGVYDKRGIILQDGIPHNTGNKVHPRTSIGYSQDRKKSI